MWLHAPYSQLEHQSQRNQWVWLDRTAKGQTLIPWQGGKPLTWDVTVVCTLGASYLSSSARSAGVAADLAASRKEAKYTSLPTRISFNRSLWNPTVRSVPVLCPSSPLWANAWRAPPATCARCQSHLFQRLSVIVQRFNSVLIYESFVSELHIDWTIFLLFVGPSCNAFSWTVIIFSSTS